MSTQPTFATDWEAVVILGGFGGVFALIWWWIIWSERRDRERMCTRHRRARVGGTFARVPHRRDTPGAVAGRAGAERAGLPTAAPPAPSTPAGVTERQAATPAGFQRSVS